MKLFILAAQYAKTIARKFIKSEKGESGVTYILITAALITILAFIIVPGIRTFATGIVSKFSTWFDGIDDNMFGSS